jgi:isopentenyl diphosphate isomerase/L-lactate dehydrogenase-like FMN-dependent dehydrogenase
MAVRDRDARNGLMFPMKLRTRGLLDLASHPAWLLRMRKAPNPTFVNYGTRTSIGAFGPVMAEQLDPDIGWKDVEWVRSLWQGPMILKGLLDPQEAREAQARGIDAVIVSNHGGRQLDGTISGIRALPAIVDAVGDKTVVLVDGGFRRGSDVVKALALGARAVLIGRPQLWGVACGGEEGVHWVLEIFAREIDRALALGGWDGIGKLNRSIFAAP